MADNRAVGTGLLAAMRGTASGTAPFPIRTVARTARGMADVEIFDRAMTLAAQAFTCVLPVMIVLATLNPLRDGSIGSSLADSLQLDDTAREALVGSLPLEDATVSSGFGIVGFLVILISATAFSRAVSRSYARAWEVERPKGVSIAWRWLAVIIALAMVTYALYAVRRAIDVRPYDGLGEASIAFIVWTGVWLWAPWLLLAGRLSWRSLAPGAVLMGVAGALLSSAGEIYLPRAMSVAARQFGSLGVAFTYISWLFVIGFAIVLTTVLGRVLYTDEGWLGRWLRAGEPATPAWAQQ